jgi:hypothetical protein
MKLEKLFFIAMGLILLIPAYAQTREYKYGTDPITVKVYVINFDPFIPQKENKRMHDAMKWNDPRKLAQGYIDAIDSVSSGYIKYQIVRWDDENVFPEKTDGYVFTPETFLECWENRETCHQPDGASYEKIIDDYKVIPMIDNGEINELWIFGAPYMGFWESAMAGPGAFYINGGVYDSIPSGKPFVIMGFSYERGVAEMIHNLSHRTEATMERFYGGWEVNKLNTNWARFAANEFQSNGVAAVGTCHYPPNGVKDYDYKNPREVESSADDWYNYPDLKGIKKVVSCETWGGPDYHLNYMKWWFSHIPKAEGKNEDGRLNNWWEYIFNFNNYNKDGSPLK